MVTLLFTAMLLVGSVLLLATVLSTYWALKLLKGSPPNLDAPFGLYPVSILKPLKGADHALAQNLESFFKLDYPCFEILFSVASYDDPAIPIVRKLMTRFPKVRSKLMIGEQVIGTNPKVNNMVQNYDLASFDWILISDSNVRVKADYLKRTMAHVETSVGVVTAVVAGVEAESFGGELEAMVLNTFYIRGMILASKAGNPCVVGKSMLFQKSTAKRFGGIRALSRYLAEDYMTGEAMAKLGLRTVIATDPIEQHIGQYTFQDFWNRHVRWARIRKSQAPVAFALESLSSTFISGSLFSLGLNHAIQCGFFEGFFCFMLVSFFCDALILKQLRKLSGLRTLGFWLVREALAFPLWIFAASGQTVIWRGKRFKIEPGGLLEEASYAYANSTN